MRGGSVTGVGGGQVREARKVRPPRNRHGERPDFLEIRVGIHQVGHGHGHGHGHDHSLGFTPLP